MDNDARNGRALSEFGSCTCSSGCNPQGADENHALRETTFHNFL